MKQALYRNYRPRSFKELVGQEHVTKTLQQAIKNDRISHAYLFTGPRGVGKTSAARILAHEVNQLPYAGESAHLDIIEIDAASNRRIDEIRDLRDKVRVAPAAGKYKVYIIDEVHMLTREAFNALLKTLEEPPAHVVFILATTEAHKLPETIISRTQRFEFRPLGPLQAAKHLADIAKSEKIDVTPDAIKLLVEFGGGSFRDSISYLDQLSAGGGKITEDDVRKVLGLPSGKTITKLLKNVGLGDQAAVLENIQSLKDQGVDAAAAASAISKAIRNQMLNSKTSSTVLLRQLIDVPASAKPYDFLEICLLEAAAINIKQPQKPQTIKKELSKSVPAAISSDKIDRPAIPDAPGFDISVWPKIIDNARDKAASIYTALRLAEPQFDGQVLTLRFQFPLHQKKIDQAKSKALVADLIEDLTGAKVRLECIVDKEAFKSNRQSKDQSATPKQTDKLPLKSIHNIFGQTEVLEA